MAMTQWSKVPLMLSCQRIFFQRVNIRWSPSEISTIVNQYVFFDWNILISISKRVSLLKSNCWVLCLWCILSKYTELAQLACIDILISQQPLRKPHVQKLSDIVQILLTTNNFKNAMLKRGHARQQPWTHPFKCHYTSSRLNISTDSTC